MNSERAREELDAFTEMFEEAMAELPGEEAKLRLLYDVAEALGQGMADEPGHGPD